MSSTDPFDRMRFTVRKVSWWQVAIILAVALALGTALALVAASVFLVVFPIIVIAGLAYRLFGGRKRAGRADGPPIIEAEYRVLSPEEAARTDKDRWDSERRVR
ncbi:hypothetical protein [Ancylobacter sp.]|uniref:hypothetical protein n=1 Tax=Ancylobacter sp. TaxID=1872567 RepID=UPI003D09BD0F